MTRARKMIAAIGVSAIVLSGCQTTGDGSPSGAVAGGATGAAAGAGSVVGTAIAGGGFSGQNLLVGLLVGAVVGAVAGNALIGTENRQAVSEADRQLADQAAQQVATDPSVGTIHWGSEGGPFVFGWAEPVAATGDKTDMDCRSVKSVHFVHGLENYEIRQFCFKDERWVRS